MNMCLKKKQLILVSSLCDGLIDCVDRSDESNCFISPQNKIVANFANCKINATNNYENHSEENVDGFGCGMNVCLDTDIWCSQKKFLSKKSLEELSAICPDIIQAINNNFLCTNQTFWQTRPCRTGYARCKGNFPGQCARVPNKNEDIFRGNFCRDKSDFNIDWRIKPDIAFQCLNGTPILVDLYCDGNKDCADETDEIELECKKCPPDFGYPGEKSKSATFSCRHGYTKNWICAVPCDGTDDLCENFEDENCSIDTTVHTVTILFSLLLLTNVLGIIYAKSEKRRYHPTESEKKTETVSKSKEFEKQRRSFRKIHQSKFYNRDLTYFYHLMATKKDSQRSKLFLSFVQNELDIHGQSVQEVLLCLKKNAGDTQLSSDVVDLLFPADIKFLSTFLTFLNCIEQITIINIEYWTYFKNWFTSMF